MINCLSYQTNKDREIKVQRHQLYFSLLPTTYQICKLCPEAITRILSAFYIIDLDSRLKFFY